MTTIVMEQSCKVLAIYACPQCRVPGLLVEHVHVISSIGQVKPDLKCPYCTFHRAIYLDEWNKKPLYACAIERWVSGKYKPEVHYMHASTPQEAQYHLGDGKYRIVAIGLAIGFFQETDKEDSRLVADKLS
jgi:hypothetical protein